MHCTSRHSYFMFVWRISKENSARTCLSFCIFSADSYAVAQWYKHQFLRACTHPPQFFSADFSPDLCQSHGSPLGRLHGGSWLDQEYTDLEWWGLEVKTRSSSRRHVQDVIRRLVKLYCTLASNTCNQNRIVIFTLSDVWRERSDRTELIYVATFNWIKKSIARHFTDDKKLSYR